MISVVTKRFRWNEWNTWHIDKHGVSPGETEDVVKGARPPFPRASGEEKWAVWGQTAFGVYLQVIYTKDPDGTIYVIHARPLTAREKQQFRRYQR